MIKKKSIPACFKYYLVILIAAFILSFIIPQSIVKVTLFIVLGIPLLLLIDQIEAKVFLFYNYSLWVMLVLFMGLKFRELRKLFPIPKIDDNRIIGFVHYNGYPMYFDTVIFLVLLLCPILMIVLYKLIYKNLLKNT